MKFVSDSIAWAKRTFAIRFDSSPIGSAPALAEFVRARSSYIAQTSLYGYLKARMGTRYRVYFEDEVFAASIRLAAARLFCTCLADLTLFAAAAIRRGGPLDDAAAAKLAREVYTAALAEGLAGYDNAEVVGTAADQFAQRLAVIDWELSCDPYRSFAQSEADLVRFAPVIDEFKEMDREIIVNSIRFRWRDVREQLARRLVPGSFPDGP